MTPKAGAHGELCGIIAIRAALAARGEKRRIILVSESAHGDESRDRGAVWLRGQIVKATSDGQVVFPALKQSLTRRCCRR